MEVAFGVLKQDYGFRRFLRRGESNVLIEVFLYALAYNINKLHDKTIGVYDIYTFLTLLNFYTTVYGFFSKWPVRIIGFIHVP